MLTFFLVLGGMGAFLFGVKFILLFIGGDMEVVEDDGGSLTPFFSIQAFFAFLMGFGWMGYIGLRYFGWPELITLLPATLFGVAMYALDRLLFRLMTRLNAEGKTDIETAVGEKGRAYLSIPKSGGGKGKVEVTVSGKKMIYDAESYDQEIKAFSPVSVISVIDSKTLLVDAID